MADPANPKSKVFISYSRKDKPFVKKLNDSLDKGNVAAWVDWEGIPPSADWMAEITRAIQESDAFVFVISPDSLASNVCADELLLGIQYSKKIIPVLYRSPEKRTKMNPKLSSTNWIYLRKEDNYKTNLPKIFDSINTDLGWVQQQTRILQRAAEWEQKNKSSGFLLGGGELEEAEKWMMASTAQESRQVTPLQAEYINLSRKFAVERQRNITIAVGVALVLSILMGVYAFFQRGIAVENEQKAIASQATAEAQRAIAEDNKRIAEQNQKIAEQNAQIAKAQRSAADAKIYQSVAGELDTSTLLAIDAYTYLPNRDAEDILRHNLSLLAVPIKQMDLGARIWNIQASPDKSEFVSADSAGQACVWKTNDGEQVFCAKQDGIVYVAVFSTDGKTLVTGTDTGAVTFWNAQNGERLSSLQYGGSIWELSVNPRGRWLAVGRTNAVTLIDMTDFKEEISFNQGGEVYATDFDPTGAYLAFGTSEGYVSVWTVMGTHTTAGPKHTNEVYDISFSPDSKWIVSGGADSTARGGLLATGGQKYFLRHGDWVEDVSFGPDPSWFVTASDDKFVRVVDTASGQEKMRMAHDGFVQKVRVSSDGRWIASTGYDKTVRLWDALTGAQIMQLPIDGIGSSLQFNEDSTRLIAGDRAGHIYLWDISSLKARAGIVQFKEYTHEAHYSPDGAWMVANTDDRNIYQITTTQLGSAADGRKIIATANGLTYNLSVSPDSRWVAAVEYDSNQVAYNRVILVNANGTDKHYLEHDGVTLYAVTFTPDSKKIITADENGLINVWTLAPLKKEFSLQADGTVLSLAVSPNGKYLAAGTDENVKDVIWDLTTKQIVAQPDELGSVDALRFSRDGKILASGGSEGVLYLWNAADGSFSRIQNDFRANGEITYLDFSPEDKWLAVSDSSGYVYILDVALGQEVARLPHLDEVTSVEFSRDGRQLATVSNKTIQLWDTSLIPQIARDQLVTAACDRLTKNLDVQKWKSIFLEEDYRPICPNLPAGGN